MERIITQIKQLKVMKFNNSGLLRFLIYSLNLTHFTVNDFLFDYISRSRFRLKINLPDILSYDPDPDQYQSADHPNGDHQA